MKKLLSFIKGVDTNLERQFKNTKDWSDFIAFHIRTVFLLLMLLVFSNLVFWPSLKNYIIRGSEYDVTIIATYFFNGIAMTSLIAFVIYFYIKTIFVGVLLIIEKQKDFLLRAVSLFILINLEVSFALTAGRVVVHQTIDIIGEIPIWKVE